MQIPNFQEMLDAGVHFGHLKRKWNPKMAPYIFMERNGIHIIDLYKTEAMLSDAAKAIRQIAKSGRQILFVATKKQAKDIVEKLVQPTGMPYVTERWTGGMLTNFRTVKKAIKKMNGFEKMEKDGTFDKISKRERLQVRREHEKLNRTLGSIAHMKRLPAAMFIVDVNKEDIAVAEAKKLHIPVFGMVDTNSDPDIDFVIPSNDDAAKSIALIAETMTKAVNDGLAERKAERKDAPKNEKKAPKNEKKTRARK